MRLGHLIGATSNATAARCRGSLASSLSKIAPILSKTASVQVGSDLFGQSKTLKGVLLMTELLELPWRDGDRVSSRDALAEAILSDRRVEAAAQPALTAIGRL